MCLYCQLLEKYTDLPIEISRLIGHQFTFDYERHLTTDEFKTVDWNTHACYKIMRPTKAYETYTNISMAEGIFKFSAISRKVHVIKYYDCYCEWMPYDDNDKNKRLSVHLSLEDFYKEYLHYNLTDNETFDFYIGDSIPEISVYLVDNACIEEQKGKSLEKFMNQWVELKD